MAEVLAGLLASSNSSSRLLSMIVNPSFEKSVPMRRWLFVRLSSRFVLNYFVVCCVWRCSMLEMCANSGMDEKAKKKKSFLELFFLFNRRRRRR